MALTEYAKSQLAQRGYTPDQITALDAGQAVSSATPQTQSQPTQPYNPFGGFQFGQQQVQKPAVQPQVTQTQQPAGAIAPTATGTGTPAQPSSQMNAQGTAMDPYSYAYLLNQLESGLAQNNTLVQSKNLLIKSLYDQPLTQQELGSLSPQLQQVLQTGSKQDVEMYIRMMNDSTQGRFQSLDSAIAFLSQGYTQQQKYLQEKYQKDLSDVRSYIQLYGGGQQAVKSLEAMYGPSRIQQLKNEGIDVEQLAGIPTVQEQSLLERKQYQQQSLQIRQQQVDNISKILKSIKPPKQVTKAGFLSGLGFGQQEEWQWQDPVTGQVQTAGSFDEASTNQNARINELLQQAGANTQSGITVGSMVSDATGLPDGTTGVDDNGNPLVVQGGQWVSQ